MANRPVTIEQARCIKETDSAIQVLVDDVKEVWIPKSLIDDDSECYQMGTEGTLVVPEWIAIDRGLV